MQRANKNGRKRINDFYDNSSIDTIVISDSCLPLTRSYRLLSRSSLNCTHWLKLLHPISQLASNCHNFFLLSINLHDKQS
ncbi:hypothetical protein T11_3938 [Trichinella zimbabwensis]|uniref:Uncharacterized protein n=1 Tax=Trichinella zimbabwensis TaxID=268475 RepID=A0A0V1H7I8_9BILA|nr:hypothetical protein T11_3938 [Trichinella zimbabwensis]